MRRKAFSLIELLVVTAVTAILGAILFPVLSQAKQAAGPGGNKFNVRKLLMASKQYSQDADDRLPIFSNGAWRNLKNVRDGQLTAYGEKRTDLWPLILLPYVDDRQVFVDPDRGDDIYRIWSGPALATSDPGFISTGNSYRSQNRFPMFGMNYLFLSPLVIPEQYQSDYTPTDFMVGESHSYSEAESPHGTIFYTASQFGFLPTTVSDTLGTLDTIHGFNAINAPGMWGPVSGPFSNKYIIFWTGTDCSGDWCGDTMPGPEVRRGTQTAFMHFQYKGNNVGFLDGHVKFLTDVEMAAGTNYLTATPWDANGQGYNGGGAVITNKRDYLWNLSDFHFGA